MDGGKAGMTHSLHRQLSLKLASAIVVLGMVAAAVSFVLSYLEAKEFQDDMLRQLAVLSVHPGMHRDANDSTVSQVISDPESRIFVYHLPGDPSPPWLSGSPASGFHTAESPDGALRIYIHDVDRGHRTLVAQSTDARDEIALSSALHTLIPLLFLLPLLAWLIMRILKQAFLPIEHLARQLDAQSAQQPEPIDNRRLPTEIIPFVDAINRLLNRLGELIAQQRRFIADASHELRTPLTALSVQIQNLRQAGSLQDVRQRMVPLQAGVDRARKLTEQLLSLARLQSEAQTRVNVDVPALVRDLLADFRPVAERKRIDLGLDEQARFNLLNSPESLRLILGNALDNALKYTPEGGEVTIRLARARGTAIIEVIDNGPGIPASERDHVFNAFYRMEGARGEGSGLGLAIAEETASRVGGKASLLDNDGERGLKFRYEQPV